VSAMPATAAQMESGNLPVTVYTPESPLREPRKLFREMFHDLRASRSLAWRLFVRDTSAQYRQSALGYLWAFLPALATTATFVFLNSQQILNAGGTTMPYPAFVIIGVVLWQTFIDALNTPLRSVNSARAMLAKINFPREALILGGVAEVLFNFLVRATLLVPVFLYYKLAVGASLLLVPLGVLALVLLGLSIGTLLVPFGMLYGDVGRGITIISGFWMLLTPVVYPLPTSGLGAFLAKWNPASPLVVTCRQWLTGELATQLAGFAVVTAVSLAALLAGWILFRLSLPHLIERMGN
jgi:lipopolysaccharide transport system permease protein